MATRFNKVIYDLFLAWWNQNLLIKNLRENGEEKSGKKLETESRRLWGREVVWWMWRMMPGVLIRWRNYALVVMHGPHRSFVLEGKTKPQNRSRKSRAIFIMSECES